MQILFFVSSNKFKDAGRKSHPSAARLCNIIENCR